MLFARAARHIRKEPMALEAYNKIADLYVRGTPVSIKIIEKLIQKIDKSMETPVELKEYIPIKIILTALNRAKTRDDIKYVTKLIDSTTFTKESRKRLYAESLQNIMKMSKSNMDEIEDSVEFMSGRVDKNEIRDLLKGKEFVGITNEVETDEVRFNEDLASYMIELGYQKEGDAIFAAMEPVKEEGTPADDNPDFIEGNEEMEVPEVVAPAPRDRRAESAARRNAKKKKPEEAAKPKGFFASLFGGFRRNK
jgi:hypothetical protein